MDTLKIKIIIIGCLILVLIGGAFYSITKRLDSIQNEVQATSNIIQTWDVHLN